MFISPEEALVHTVTVTLSLVVLGVSVVAYKRRGGGRYLSLMVAFVFLSTSELIQFAESFFFNAFIYLPLVGIHLTHLFDLAMLVSFGLALWVK
jgi:hypothetical protein